MMYGKGHNQQTGLHRPVESADEESPLLPKVAVQHPHSLPTDDTVLKTKNIEEVSFGKLLCIMVSVWIGTFCAGLGEWLVSDITNAFR